MGLVGTIALSGPMLCIQPYAALMRANPTDSNLSREDSGEATNDIPRKS